MACLGTGVCCADDDNSTQEKPTLESAVDNGKRAFALKKFEEAVDHYATALEIAYVDTLASCQTWDLMRLPE